MVCACMSDRLFVSVMVDTKVEWRTVLWQKWNLNEELFEMGLELFLYDFWHTGFLKKLHWSLTLFMNCSWIVHEFKMFCYCNVGYFYWQYCIATWTFNYKVANLLCMFSPKIYTYYCMFKLLQMEKKKNLTESVILSKPTSVFKTEDTKIC